MGVAPRSVFNTSKPAGAAAGERDTGRCTPCTLRRHAACVLAGRRVAQTRGELSRLDSEPLTRLQRFAK